MLNANRFIPKWLLVCFVASHSLSLSYFFSHLFIYFFEKNYFHLVAKVEINGFFSHRQLKCKINEATTDILCFRCLIALCLFLLSLVAVYCHSFPGISTSAI